MVEEGCDAEKGCDLFSLDSVDKLLCEVRYSYLEIGNGSTCPPRYFIPSDELCFFPRLFLSRGVFFEKKRKGKKGKREKGKKAYRYIVLKDIAQTLLAHGVNEPMSGQVTEAGR